VSAPKAPATQASSVEVPPPASVSRAEATRVWARIGLQSFGGPAAQIALMHRVLVEERRWIDERLFLRALGFCMLLPGPEAMQLATYAGWRLHGVRGGLTAGLWFVLPGAVLLTLLATLYALFGQIPAVSAAFLGIKAAVLVLVYEALVRLSKRALTRPVHRVIAPVAFLALFFLAIPFPFVVLAAAAVGAALIAPDAVPEYRETVRAPWPKVAGTAVTWAAIWLGPLAALAAWLGPDHILARLALFFSKLAVVTFGGAYAVLAYMAQDVVVKHGWLTARQMVDALGLAETTPGPLILVNLFVGFLAAAHAHPGAAIALGLAGAAVALWATFAPCFLWIFVAGPYVERISAEPRLRGALEGITAAVLGVIASLGLWFGVHVLFGEVRTGRWGILRWTVPVLSSFDLRVLVLTAVCAVLFVRFRWSVHRVLAVSALLALGIWALL
jgi:chromate transporter